MFIVCTVRAYVDAYNINETLIYFKRNIITHSYNTKSRNNKSRIKVI